MVAVGICVLWLAGKLTLEGAAALTVLSALVPLVALGTVFRRALPPAVDLRLLREGLSFGGRASVGVVATMANQRLDQLMMIPLVPPRELGLYTVAVTIASFSTALTGQVVTVFLPRIAAGESHIVPRASRCVLLVALSSSVVIALGTAVFLVPLFGEAFASARTLVYVLLIGWIFQAALSALSQGLPAVGRPGAPSVGELISLAITVPGLVLLLPSMGAMGAALITVVAYATTFAVLVVIASRHLGDHVYDYVIPRRADVTALAKQAGSYLAAVRRRVAPSRDY
jgi:O-antigen/teichoic acid export membrane protein